MTNWATLRQKAPRGKGRDITSLTIQDLENINGLTFNFDLTSSSRSIYWALVAIGRALCPGQSLVADIESRAAMGEAKYGERLRAFNGRDARLDLYQEILDAIVYARQVIEEKEKQ